MVLFVPFTVVVTLSPDHARSCLFGDVLGLGRLLWLPRLRDCLLWLF